MKLHPCLAIAALFLSGASATAQTLPAYMAPISGKSVATAADIATKDMLALNTGMFELYGDAAKIFQKNVLSKHPAIPGRYRIIRPPAPENRPRITGCLLRMFFWKIFAASP